MAGPVNNRTSPARKVGLLAELIRNAELVWRLLRDSRVPSISKFVIPGIVAVYLLSPIDLMPDLIPVLGQLDDVAVLALAAKMFIELAPAQVVREHLQEIAGRRSGTVGSSRDGETVDGEYRVID